VLGGEVGEKSAGAATGAPTPIVFSLRPTWRQAPVNRPDPAHHGSRLAAVSSQPVDPDVSAAAGLGRCALPCVRSRAQFPFAPERRYTPCDASCQQLFALRDRLGVARNVVVQATCHGADNRAVVDALERSQAGRAGWQPCDARNAARARPAARGRVGACASTSFKRLVDFTPREELMEIRAPDRAAGWHVVVYFEAADLPELWNFFTLLPPRSWSTTWGARTSRSRSMGPSSNASCD